VDDAVSALAQHGDPGADAGPTPGAGRSRERPAEAGPAAVEAPARPAAGRASRRGVVAYLALAFGLAWVPELAALARGVRVAPPTPGGTALLALVMFAPGASAFLVRRFVTREGFADAGLRVGPRRLYLAAWLGVPLLVAAVYGLTAALGLGTVDPTLAAAAAAVAAAGGEAPPPPVLAFALLGQSLTVGVLVTAVATFGEEFGWTGYLLPKLLPLGRWRAALAYGTAWGLWHAPSSSPATTTPAIRSPACSRCAASRPRSRSCRPPPASGPAACS
jgi:hypothetical protein